MVPIPNRFVEFENPEKVLRALYGTLSGFNSSPTDTQGKRSR